MTHYNKARLITIRRTTVTATVMLGVMLFLIAIQTAASIVPAADAYTLSPKNADPAPTIDGVIDTSWGTQNRSVMELRNSTGSNTQLIQVYTTVFNDFIYFGLQFRSASHSVNESLAIACSNMAPGSTSVDDNIYSYSVVKIVKIDGMSWDWKVLPGQNEFSEWSELNGNSIELKVGFSSGNFSFYELRFARVLSREMGGDVNWSRKQSYIIKIFYGTQFGGFSDRFEPAPGSWTMATQKITLTIPAAPDDPTSLEIKELELNMLTWKISLFIVAGFALSTVGVFVVRTKSRIRRL